MIKSTCTPRLHELDQGYDKRCGYSVVEEDHNHAGEMETLRAYEGEEKAHLHRVITSGALAAQEHRSKERMGLAQHERMSSGKDDEQHGGHVGDEVRSQVQDRTITWIDGHLVGWASSQRFISLLGVTNPYAFGMEINPLYFTHFLIHNTTFKEKNKWSQNFDST